MCSDPCHIDSLRALVCHGLIEFHFLTFLEGLEAFHIDALVVDKNILALGIGDEAESFLIIKPFDSASARDTYPPII